MITQQFNKWLFVAFKRGSAKKETESGKIQREEVLQKIIAENPTVKSVVTVDTEGEPLVRNPTVPPKKKK